MTRLARTDMQFTIHDKLFRHRSLYVWGDPHLSHGDDTATRGVIAWGPRPFTGISDMDGQMIDALNALPDDALVICTGDLHLGKEAQLLDFLSRTKIQIVCVRGNHDPDQRIMTIQQGEKFIHRDQSFYFNNPLHFPSDERGRWRIFYLDRLVLKGITYETFEGQPINRIIFDHYPLEEWDGCDGSGILFHGHVHHNDEADRMKGRLNICVDVLASRFCHEWLSVHSERTSLGHFSHDLQSEQRFRESRLKRYMPLPIQDAISLLEWDRQHVRRACSDNWPSHKEKK